MKNSSTIHRSAAQRKILGGTNFLVVLWALLSMFRLVLLFDRDTIGMLFNTNTFVFILPILFLVVLNLLMGLSSFYPSKKNNMWVISLMLVAITLVALNTMQLKMELISEQIYRYHNPGF